MNRYQIAKRVWNEYANLVLWGQSPGSCPCYSFIDWLDQQQASPISNKTCNHTKITEGCACCHEWAYGTPAPEQQADVPHRLVFHAGGVAVEPIEQQAEEEDEPSYKKRDREYWEDKDG